MPDFGAVALRAVELFRAGLHETPRSAWQAAAKELLANHHAQVKNCPRATFLSLCQAGLISGIPLGNYVNAKENSEHTLAAVELLGADPSCAELAPLALWRMIEGTPPRHDYQMNVVLELWRHGVLSRR